MMVAESIRRNLPEDQYKGKSNEEVVMHFRRRECSFDQVLLRYHNLLVSKSQTKMPGMDPDDLYQELAIRLLHCCDKWDPEKGVKFITYLTESLSNQIRWILRKQLETNARKLNYEDMVRLDQFVTDNDGDEYRPDEPSVTDDLGATEFLCGLSLSKRERQCLQMVLVGMNNTQIGAALGVSRNRVSQILRGIGKRLQNDLEEVI